VADTAAAPLYLLDTNAVSHAAKHPHGPVADRMSQLLPGQAVITVLVEGELRYGIAKAGIPAIEQRVNLMLARIPILELDSGIAKRYGLLRADLAKKGTPIGMNDLWIAAHALTAGLTVVTDNENEFSRVPGLLFENWQRNETSH
jgi:tRNA(fMet)-specific endonuclease VapC